MTKFSNIVVLTGAGISAESGIPTFRASDGLWENHPVEEVATPEGFARNPALVHEFYNARRKKAQSVKPNAAHLALAEFEAEHDGNFLLVTQNVDNLHERAGSKNLIHMHGGLFTMKCNNCGAVWAEMGDTSPEDQCPNCHKSSTRQDIVWFGEMPYQMDEIGDALSHADLFISIGTSGNVYPAAGFVQTARFAGAKCVEVNLEKSQNAYEFDEGIYGKAGEKLPAFLKSLQHND